MNINIENKQADKTMEIAFFIISFISFIISPIYDTFSLSISIIALLLSAYYVSKYALKGSSFYQYVGSACSALFTALLIYQMHGMIEMHFVAFISSILLINYRKWQLQLPLTLLVVIHHGVLAYIQYLGYQEVYFTTDTYMDLQTFVVHVLLAAIIFFLCGYWAFVFNKTQNEVEIKNSQLQFQIDGINKNINVANQIAQGNYNSKIDANDKDQLGKALLSMQNNLLEAKKREDEERYFNIGLAQSSEILRNNNDNLSIVCNDILIFLTKYMSANQASIFVVFDGEGEEEKYLELMACFAYDRKKFLNKRILINEGLAGACYLEKEIIYLTEVPEDYVKINSGLGEANPTCILMSPLIINDEVYGVIEMAFFKPLEQHKIDFIKKISENIAATISTVKINERTKSLLEISQNQAEQMRTQEEEMRQNMEEMSATQEEMTRKQQELSTLLIEANQLKEQMTLQEAINMQRLDEIQKLNQEILNKNKQIELLKSQVSKN